MLRIIKSLIMIAGVAAIAAGGTSAYFRDKERVVGNTFATGTLDLSVSPQEAAVNVADAEPGVWYPSAKITAINNSTIDGPLKWKISDRWISGPMIGMWGEMEGSLWVQGLGYDQNPKTAPDGTAIEAQNVWNGDLKDLSYQFNNMPKGNSASIWLFTKLKNGAGDQFQGKALNFNLIFDATQSVNPGW